MEILNQEKAEENARQCTLQHQIQELKQQLENVTKQKEKAEKELRSKLPQQQKLEEQLDNVRSHLNAEAKFHREALLIVQETRNKLQSQAEIEIELRAKLKDATMQTKSNEKKLSQLYVLEHQLRAQLEQKTNSCSFLLDQLNCIQYPLYQKMSKEELRKLESDHKTKLIKISTLLGKAPEKTEGNNKFFLLSARRMRCMSRQYTECSL